MVKLNATAEWASAMVAIQQVPSLQELKKINSYCVMNDEIKISYVENVLIMYCLYGQFDPFN